VKRFLQLQFFNVRQSVEPLWTSDQPGTRPLPTHKHRINADKDPCDECDSDSVFERATTFHALDRAATEIEKSVYIRYKNIMDLVSVGERHTSLHAGNIVYNRRKQIAFKLGNKTD
jgi:hypothetical protein